MHLRIVTPIATADFGAGALPELRAALRPTTRLDMVGLDSGPASIETELEEALAVPDTLRRVAEAAADGCDAVVLNCVGDPGLAAARELVSIPVLGPGQVAMHLACLLGARFSIRVARERGVRPMQGLVARYGLRERLASVLSLDIPILELGDQQRLLRALLDQARGAIERDRADVIVLGSTGMVAIGRLLAERLREVGAPVPVVDPLLCAVILAEGLVAAGLRPYRDPAVARDGMAPSDLLRVLLRSSG